MVTSWITSSVSDDIRKSIIYYNTAQAMWSALKHRYHRNDNFRIYQIKTQLWNLKQQDMDINKYFTRFITLWNELKYYKPPVVCTCGGVKEALAKYEQEECLTQFLHVVKQSHRQTINMILTKEPLPDVYWALKCLECEESRRPIDDYRTLFMERRRF